MTDTLIAPQVTDPQTEEGDHDRFTHIVLEGFKTEDDEFITNNNSVIDSMVFGTPIKTLCGRVFSSSRDPSRYPVCPTCKEIAERRGWKVPA